MSAPTLRDLVYALLNAGDVRGTESDAKARADRVTAQNLAALHDEFTVASAHGTSGDAENYLRLRYQQV